MRNRWRRVPGWKRWSACTIVGIVGISAIGATVQLEDEPSSIRTSDGSTPIGAATTTERTDVPQPSASSPTSTDRTTSTSVTSTSAPPSTTASPSTTPPPAPSATTPDAEAPPAPPGSVASLDVLALIRIERETPEGYNRELFGYGTRVDGFGCRTRALVLIRDSLTPAQIDRGGCAVVAGDWFSTYDGLTWSDPGEVQIDHVVALKEAWDSGASQWDAARLEEFANDVDDPRTLRLVTGEVNLAKSANDPVNWLPPDPSALCQYLADWVSIKARWGLAMDESEHGRVRNLLTDRCPDQLVAPWVEVPQPNLTDPVVPPVIAPSPPTPAPPPAPPAPAPDAGRCDPAYPTVCLPPAPPDLDCGDISFRRFQVLPPDPHNFDGNDNDGLGCES